MELPPIYLTALLTVLSAGLLFCVISVSLLFKRTQHLEWAFRTDLLIRLESVTDTKLSARQRQRWHDEAVDLLYLFVRMAEVDGLKDAEVIWRGTPLLWELSNEI